MRNENWSRIAVDSAATIIKFKGSSSPNWKPKLSKVCIFCKNAFLIHPYRKLTAIFCSRKCKQSHMIETNLGFPLRPHMSKYETSILDNLQNCFGYPIERQYRVGGYYIDGYCKFLNLPPEVDENHHKYRLERDLKREEQIKDLLGCHFLRLQVK